MKHHYTCSQLTRSRLVEILKTLPQDEYEEVMFLADDILAWIEQAYQEGIEEGKEQAYEECLNDESLRTEDFHNGATWSMEEVEARISEALNEFRTTLDLM